jgi:hypothetical protein
MDGKKKADPYKAAADRARLIREWQRTSQQVIDHWFSGARRRTIEVKYLH